MCRKNGTLIVLEGEGQVETLDAKLSEKCLCSHHNNTASIKQISMCDTQREYIYFILLQVLVRIFWYLNHENPSRIAEVRCILVQK